MSDTPEDLERRRLQKRLVELRNQLAEISGGEHTFGPAGEGMTLEMEVAFLEQIVAFETAPQTSWLDRLSESGYDMPDPSILSDAEIGLEVWQVIQRLSELRVYLSSTNHLSDRQLYEHLYQDSLREVTQHMPDDPDTACHIDILGGCSEADLELWLRYYADDQERADWRERFPDFVVPQSEKPPFERDHLLPERAYETSPLSEYLNRLANTEWDDPNNPVRLAADLTPDELAGTEIYQTARVLLEGLRETGRAKATAKSGNLCRAFVKQLHPSLPLRKEVREAHERHYKILNESDLRVLNEVRFAAQDSGLIKKQKGFFSLTRKGQSLLEPSRSGELYRTLFTTLFSKIDLAYFDPYADLPILQGTLPISLWRLGIVAREWIELEELVVQTLLPEAVDALELERREYLPPGYILDARLWRHLAEVGLLESNRTSPDTGINPRSYRITPLFDRFLSFDPLEMP